MKVAGFFPGLRTRPAHSEHSSQEVKGLNVSAKSLSWSAAAILLLLSILAPPFNMVTSLLLMTPFIVLYTMLKPGAFAAHVVPVAVVAFFLAGSYGPVVIALGVFFLVPSIVMGHLYKKGAPARKVVLTGFVVILAELLAELVLFSWQFDVNFSDELRSALYDNMKELETNGMFAAGWAAKAAAAYTDAIMTAMPMLLLMSAFLLAVVTQGLSRKALRTIGVEAPAMPRAKTWAMPRSLVFYYLLATIVSYAITAESSEYWRIAITNLIPILQFLFVLQAIGFVFFLADAKRWPKAAPVLLSVPIVLFMQPLFLIGLLDVAFSLRRYFVKE